MELEYETLVTQQDYLYHTGVDLEVELTAITINDVGDNPVPRFIYGIEDFLKDYYSSQYNWDGQFKTDHQIKHFKKAVIYQIQYIIRNGTIINDSGYNTATGQIVPRETLEKIGVGAMAHRMMRNGGMANWRRH